MPGREAAAGEDKLKAAYCRSVPGRIGIVSGGFGRATCVGTVVKGWEERLHCESRVCSSRDSKNWGGAREMREKRGGEGGRS